MKRKSRAPKDPRTVISDLIARKEHARAIAFLRGRFKGRSPGPRLRLELADVLVLAGKGEEAVPILMEVTEELLAHGNVATAMATLKKVEQIDPEASRLEKRVASLLGQKPAPPVPPPEPSPPEPARGDERAKTQPVDPEVSRRLAEPSVQRDDDESDTAPVILPPEPAALGGANDAAAGSASDAATGPGEVGDRIRTVFRRFLATLPGGVAESASAAAQVESVRVAPPEPEASAVTAPDSGGESSSVMSAEDFRTELLNLVHDLAQSRPAPPASAQDPEFPVAATVAGSPLFRDLSPAELTAVLRGLRLHRFEGGDIILTEGERGDSVYIVAKGIVRVWVRNPEGRNFPVGEVGEGDFFGEIGSLSGRPRSATVTAAGRCELLEIDKAGLDRLAHEHPRAREVLEELYIRRASSPEAAAVRAVPLVMSDDQRRAVAALEALFGESRWDPRIRLRLAAVLLRAGKYEDTIPILVHLADDLARQGYPEKAIAVLKKIERIQHRNVEELSLAPRSKSAAPAGDAVPLEPPAGSAARRPGAGNREGFFQDWLLDMVRKTVHPAPSDSFVIAPADSSALRAYAPGLLASPLFAGFSEDELLAVIQELRLVTFEPGDIVVTEGEPGESVFILAVGAVKVFTRDAGGRSVAKASLKEGGFFGEIAALTGRPRTATVTVAAHSEMLELEPAALQALDVSHPGVRVVLEAAYRERRADGRGGTVRTAPS
jgi:CRP-like cAMP-binding protein